MLAPKQSGASDSQAKPKRYLPQLTLQRIRYLVPHIDLGLLEHLQCFFSGGTRRLDMLDQYVRRNEMAEKHF